MEKTSTVQDSLTRQTRMLMYQDLNTRGKLYGGRLLEWIDMVAGITAGVTAARR